MLSLGDHHYLLKCMQMSIHERPFHRLERNKLKMKGKLVGCVGISSLFLIEGSFLSSKLDPDKNKE